MDKNIIMNMVHEKVKENKINYYNAANLVIAEAQEKNNEVLNKLTQILGETNALALICLLDSKVDLSKLETLINERLNNNDIISGTEELLDYYEEQDTLREEKANYWRNKNKIDQTETNNSEQEKQSE